MKRHEFFAAAGTLGACVCCPGVAFAQTPTAGAQDPEVKQLKGSIDFMRKRMARLVRALDEPTRTRVLETLGRECAREFSSMTEPFRGKPREYVEEARRRWASEATYDEAAGTIRVAGRPGPCVCPFVQAGLTPTDFCTCSLSWQKEVFSVVLNRPVDAQLESSVLRGGTQCTHRIQARA